ncbi:tyramine beta-hydroxylase [Chrysoperla carnea]|uniref:tyramine beta-hydroxylase n=1 Tax=Chrysoperla carnea TaxID=189513 RepID=UPI001D06D9FF|nr:tyramine beta-hydroxylase [Chrysoperla carnea]
MITIRIITLLFIFVYFTKIVYCLESLDRHENHGNHGQHHHHHTISEGHDKIFDLTLDNIGKVKLYWKIDYPNKELQFEIHYYKNFAKWFAFGFSSYGELAPADYCVLWTYWNDTVVLEDTYADFHGILHRDIQQDCADFKLVATNKIVKFSFKRKFSTCDLSDFKIEDGTVHLVWVSGTNKLYNIEGVNVLKTSGAQHGMVRTTLLKNTDVDYDVEPGSWNLDFVVDNVHVPADDTTYWCKIFKLPEKIHNRKYHISRFESLITKGNEGLVHHMEVFRCIAPSTQVISDYEGSCFSDKRPKDTQVCKKVLAAWAMGALPFVYPKEAGLPIGGPNYNLYVMIEVHYDNPKLKADWIDSSGFRLTISPNLRKYDAGIMELGLEYIDKMAIPPQQEKFYLSGHCIIECTEVGLPKDGVIVVGSQLHSHLTGVQVFTKHIRNGVELPELNRDNYFSTHFQEIRRLKKPVRILPGDALITTCGYNTMSRTNITLGGFAITDEMCVNYIHYYPVTELEVCKSSISDKALQQYFTYMRDYESQPTSMQLGISDNYNSIEWTKIRAILLDSYYNESPISMQCNMSNGDRFPGNWDNMEQVHIDVPLILQNDCRQNAYIDYDKLF